MSTSRLVLAACLALCACSESHDTPGGSDEPEAGLGGNAAAGRSTAGSGGRTSAAGRGGSTGSGTGCSDCQGASVLGLIQVPGCCTADNKCGLDLSQLLGSEGCSEQNQPGAADTACPSSNLGGFLTLGGCCRPDGSCGALDTFVGLGCTATGTADAPAQSCKPK